MNRRLTAAILCVLMLALAACGGKSEKENKPAAEEQTASVQEAKQVEKYTPVVHEDGIYYVGVVQQAGHEDLSLASEGFRSRLSELMGEEVVIDVKVADGTTQDCDVIIDHFLQDKDDLIVAGGSTAVARAYAATKDVPIVGLAVTDFVVLGGVSSVHEPGANVTGISDLPPMESQRDLLVGVADGGRIGLVYCSEDSGAGFQCKVMKKYLDESDVEYDEYTFTDVSNLEAALTKACDECGTIYLPNDSLLAQNMETVKNISLAKKVKVFASTESMCKDGALCAYGIDYYELGKRGADMAFDILTYWVDKPGEYADDEEAQEMGDPGEIEIDRVRDTAGAYYNPVIAEQLDWTPDGNYTELEVERPQQPDSGAQNSTQHETAAETEEN